MFRMRRDNDPVRRAEYLLKKKKQYADDVSSKKRKKVQDMTKRELRMQRGEWRKRQQLCRSARKAETTKDDSDCVVSSTVSNGASSSQGRCRIQRNKTALYKENMRLHHELSKYKRMAEKYKKRYSRMKQPQSRTSSNETPRRSTDALLRSGNQDKIRRTLRFHKVLMAQIVEKYKHARTPGQKRNDAAIVSGHIIQKYRQTKLLASQLGMTHKIYKASVELSRGKPTVTFSSSAIRKTYLAVRSFYEEMTFLDSVLERRRQ